MPYSLSEQYYVLPTPAGAYFAVSSGVREPLREMLRSLLSLTVTPKLSASLLQDLAEPESENDALDIAFRMQKLGWLQGVETPLNCPDQPLEDILPTLLSQLCDSGKALLADSHGFFLGTSGFPHEVAEELSALSAELSEVYDKRVGLLSNNLGLQSSAWAMVDASGCSQIGFWPLYIGDNKFVLVMSGLPKLNQPAFLDLIWTLSMRYSA